jgi:DNA-binding response OmpR family regulator
MSESSSSQSSIMIVDDNPASLRLLEDMLRKQGHEVRSFPNGQLALAAAERNPPDLIMLDVRMPDMNGYEVCARIKSSAAGELALTPVIFLSGLSATEDKVKAFRSGAVDYISKPFQFEEVQARVETHLRLHRLKQALARQNEALEETVRRRTHEYVEANERLRILDRSKSEFLRLISHELRTPLNGLIGVGEVALDSMPAGEMRDELREMFEQSKARMLPILEDALLLTQIDVDGEKFCAAPVSLSAALTGAAARAGGFAATRGVTVAPPPADLGFVVGDEDLLTRAFRALLETAVRFSAEGETVRIEAEVEDGSRRIHIASRGRALPAPAMEGMFNIFAVAEADTAGIALGLGPALAQRVLALFGAAVSVASLDDAPGVRLTIEMR